MSTIHRVRLGVIVAAVVLLVLGAVPAAADTATFTLTLNNCSGGGGLCTAGPYGTVTLTLNGNKIDVTVEMLGGNVIAGGGPAFGFNVAGGNAGLAVEGLPAGWSFVGEHQIDGFGTFDGVINGPEASAGVTVLTFTVSRTGGFDSVSGLIALSSGGTSVNFAAHVIPPNGAATGYAGSVVPEPGTLALLGTGLLAVGGVLRRRLGL